MRPINKGNQPLNDDGTAVISTNYTQWRKALIKAIGYYCVYCNVPLSHSLQVEHVIPQNPPPGFTPGNPLAWHNLLLACGPCNNAKSNTPVSIDDYYLPDKHNTYLPFSIHQVDSNNMAVTEMEGLSVYQKKKARKTIELLKLDNIDDRTQIVDIRSQRRYGAMKAVQASKQLFDIAKDSPTFDIIIAAENIAIQAKAIGFFNLWYKVFEHESEVMQKLTDNEHIKGTAQDCFDPKNGYNPIPRNPLNTIDVF